MLSAVPPLFVIEFLHRVVNTFEDYFTDCTESTIKDNYVVVYEVDSVYFVFIRIISLLQSLELCAINFLLSLIEVEPLIDFMSYHKQLALVLYHRRIKVASLWLRDTLLAFLRKHNDSPRFVPKSTCLLRSALFAVLMFSAGDVELNPGRAEVCSINIGCLNCCSAVSKIALLHDLMND